MFDTCSKLLSCFVSILYHSVSSYFWTDIFFPVPSLSILCQATPTATAATTAATTTTRATSTTTTARRLHFSYFVFVYIGSSTLESLFEAQARKFIMSADKAKKLSWQTHRNEALFASIPIIIWSDRKYDEETFFGTRAGTGIRIGISFSRCLIVVWVQRNIAIAYLDSLTQSARSNNRQQEGMSAIE